MTKLPLMTPMKIVGTDRGEFAVLKPVVKPIAEPGRVKAPSAFTDTRLKTIRAKLIKLSYLGYMLYDGLQLGIDKGNRVLQFDTGAMKYTAPKKGQINNRPFTVNTKNGYFCLKNFTKTLKNMV